MIDKSGRHVSSDQLANTLRVNRDGTQFEIICDRQRNNYETSLNAFGNIFTSDNDDDGNRGCRVIWAMDGGHYGYRTPGSPRHWGEEVPATCPSWSAPATAARAASWSTRETSCPRNIAGPFSKSTPAPPGQFLPADASRGPHSGRSTRCSSGQRPVVPAGRRLRWPGRLGLRGRLVRRGGRRPRVQRSDDRADLPRAPKGHRSQKVKADFASPAGLIAALKSPNIATQDAARSGLIARGEGSGSESAPSSYTIRTRFSGPGRSGCGTRSRETRSRWSSLTEAVKQGEPRIREQAVRILGRDCRENGRVEYEKPRPGGSRRAQNLEILTALADDPDAGVRRELILAFRNLPTDKVGDAL